MKVVILAGGFGTRISEESHLKPKPMIEIGEKPILWHIMKIILNTPLSNILGIQLHHFLKVRDIASSTHLPQPGQSRSKRHSSSMMWFILLPLIECWRSGA